MTSRASSPSHNVRRWPWAAGAGFRAAQDSRQAAPAAHADAVQWARDPSATLT